MKNRLSVLRAERGWSQHDLAARLGVSRQTVNALERERYDPSLPLAFKIGALFDRRIEEIFFPDGAASAGPGARPAAAVRSEQRAGTDEAVTVEPPA